MIVTKVEQRMALVDALKTQLTASRATAANLVAERTLVNPSDRQRYYDHTTTTLDHL